MNSYIDLVRALLRRCEQEHWFGAWEEEQENGRGRTRYATDTFVCAPATRTQLQQTEEILGFPLPEVISVLYTELANGGFGPGYGLRGAVGGYGTVGTVLPKGERWRSDETLVMYHARRDGHLVDLHRYASRWQEEGRRRWLELPADGFPLQCFPICSLGCDQEVVVNKDGHVFYWGPAEEKDMFTFSDRRMSFEQWMWMLLKNYPDAIYTLPA